MTAAATDAASGDPSGDAGRDPGGDGDERPTRGVVGVVRSHPGLALAAVSLVAGAALAGARGAGVAALVGYFAGETLGSVRRMAAYDD